MEQSHLAIGERLMKESKTIEAQVYSIDDGILVKKADYGVLEDFQQARFSDTRVRNGQKRADAAIKRKAKDLPW